MTTIEEIEKKLDALIAQQKEILKGMAGFGAVISGIQNVFGMLANNLGGIENMQKIVADSEKTGQKIEIIYKWIGKMYTDQYKPTVEHVVSLDAKSP